MKEAGDIFHALKIYPNSFGQFTKIFYSFFSLLVTSSSTCFLLIYCNELLFNLIHTILLMPVYCKYEIFVVKDVVKNHFRRTTRAINADVGKLTYLKILQWEYLTDKHFILYRISWVKIKKNIMKFINTLFKYILTLLFPCYQKNSNSNIYTILYLDHFQ